MIVDRPSGKRGYVIAGCRIASQTMSAWPGVRAALFINDPESEPEPVQDRLTRLFGLTPREASIAQVLSGGGSIDDACEKLGVLRPTVRTHLQNLFQKLDVSRQSELVSVVHRSLAGLPRQASA
jgi:DNA-binding CsgD family transcriptional regulator